MFLTPTQTRALVAHALEHRYAVLAINIDSPSGITDCLEAALAADAPIVLETSLWQLLGRSFGAGDAFLGMARYIAQIQLLAESARYQDVPVAFHTDHIKGPETLALLQRAILGFDFAGVRRLRASSVSLDASELTHAENIRSIRALCETATDAKQDITLEMEAGVDDGITALAETEVLLGAIHATHPGRIAWWAPGVGTRHGLGNQDAFSSEAVAAQQKRATEICGYGVGVALHGSSGLPNEALRRAIAAGACKINWSSESLLVRSQAAQDFFASHQNQLRRDHNDWKITAMDNGLQSFVAARYLPVLHERLETLGAAGQGKRFLTTL